MSSKTRLTIFTLTDILLVFICAFDSYTFNDKVGLFSAATRVLCIVYTTIIVYDLIHKPFKLKSHIFPIILIITVLISACYGKGLKLLTLTLAIVSFKGINLDKYIARDAIIRTIETLIVMGLYIYHNNFAVYPVDSGARLRYELGLGHPNILGIMLAIIAIEYMYLFRNKHSWIAYLYTLFMIYFNIEYISSRTALIVLVFALVCFLILKIFPNILKFKVFQFLIENSFVIFTLLTFLAIYLYGQGNAYAIKLDDLFSGRLHLANNYIKYYGFSLFGTGVGDWTITKTGENLAFFDQGFPHLIIKYGIITGVIHAVIYNRAFHYFFKKGNYNIVIILLSFLVSGLMERYLFKLEFFTMVGILGLWMDDKTTKDESNFELNTKLISVLSSMLIVSIAFVIVYYNSNASILTDGLNILNNQYTSILNLFGNIKNQAKYVYETGTNIYTLLSNNLISPFNIFIPILKLIDSKFNYLFFFVIKLFFASIFSTLWISKLANKRSSIVIGSLLYSLSSIILVSFGTNFVDTYCFIPLVLFFVEKKIQNNKNIGLYISLILLILISENYLILTTVTILTYIIFRYIILKASLRDIFFFTLEIVLIPICLSFIVIPCIEYSNGIISNRNSVYGKLSIILETINLNNAFSISNYSSLSVISLLPSILFIKERRNKLAFIAYFVISYVLSAVLSFYYLQTAYVLMAITIIYLIIKLIDYNIIKNKYFITVYSILFFLCLGYKLITYIDYDSNLILYSLITVAFIYSTLFSIKYKSNIVLLMFVFDISLSTFSFIPKTTDFEKIVSLNDVFTTETVNGDDSLFKTIDLNYADKLYSQDLNTTLSLDDYYQNFAQDNYNLCSLLSENQSNGYIGYKKNMLAYYNISGVKYIKLDNETTQKEFFTPEEVTNITYLASLNSDVLNNGVYIIRSKDDPNKVITYNQETDNIELSDYNNSPTQLWRVYHDEGGFISFTNLFNNLVMNLDEASLENNTNISLLAGNGGSNQKWIAINRDEYIEVVSSLNSSKAINSTNGNIDIYDYSNQLWIFDSLGDTYSVDIPNYYNQIEGSDYFANPYYIELGYVNNKTIDSNYLIGDEQFFDTYTREEILREYVAIENVDNKSYDLIDEPIQISDYIYDSYYEQSFDEPLTNTTLVVRNGSIPIIDIDLYYKDKLVKTKHYYQYNFCNIQINIGELVDKVVVNFKDIDETNSAIVLYTMKNSDAIENELYNQRINNAFTNVTFNNNYISANINISEDNSLVYTYVPYDNNWVVTVDNQEVETVKANYGYIAFRLDAGEHNVQFTYKLKHIKLYLLASAISLVLLIIINVLKRCRKI